MPPAARSWAATAGSAAGRRSMAGVGGRRRVVVGAAGHRRPAGSPGRAPPRRRRRSAPDSSATNLPAPPRYASTSRAFVCAPGRVADLGHRVVGAIGVGRRRADLEAVGSEAGSSARRRGTGHARAVLDRQPHRGRRDLRDRCWSTGGVAAQPGERRRGLRRVEQQHALAVDERRGSTGSVYIGNAVGSVSRNAQHERAQVGRRQQLVAGEARRRSCRRPC